MSKTFSILVTRDVTETGSVLIAAFDENAAREAALARADTDFDLVWELDADNPPRPAYITSCIEEA